MKVVQSEDQLLFRLICDNVNQYIERPENGFQSISSSLTRTYKQLTTPESSMPQPPHPIWEIENVGRL